MIIIIANLHFWLKGIFVFLTDCSEIKSNLNYSYLQFFANLHHKCKFLCGLSGNCWIKSILSSVSTPYLCKNQGCLWSHNDPMSIHRLNYNKPPPSGALGPVECFCCRFSLFKSLIVAIEIMKFVARGRTPRHSLFTGHNCVFNVSLYMVKRAGYKVTHKSISN